MNIFERVSKALRKRWSRHGWGPKSFVLNFNHWELLHRYILKRHPCWGNETGWLSGEVEFLGTKLIRRK